MSHIGDSTLSISGSTLSGNTSGDGGGLFSSGDAQVNTSTTSDNMATILGGGISNKGGSTVVVSDSTVSGNSAGTNGGGASTFLSELTVINSTFSGNSATNSGGGFHIGGSFGIPTPGNLTLVNSTVTGNSAGSRGGGVYAQSYFEFETSTLFPLGTATVSNSIISGNTASANFSDVYGTFYSNDTNLIGDKAGATRLENDLTATAAETLDTNLADNGGPTLTHALVTGSPAIDAGTPMMRKVTPWRRTNEAPASTEFWVQRWTSERLNLNQPRRRP